MTWSFATTVSIASTTNDDAGRDEPLRALLGVDLGDRRPPAGAGLTRASRAAISSTLSAPNAPSSAWSCRFAFVSSTRSPSTIVTRPTPARTSASAAKLPTPPTPSTTTCARSASRSMASGPEEPGGAVEAGRDRAADARPWRAPFVQLYGRSRKSAPGVRGRQRSSTSASVAPSGARDGGGDLGEEGRLVAAAVRARRLIGRVGLEERAGPAGPPGPPRPAGAPARTSPGPRTRSGGRAARNALTCSALPRVAVEDPARGERLLAAAARAAAPWSFRQWRTTGSRWARARGRGGPAGRAPAAPRMRPRRGSGRRGRTRPPPPRRRARGPRRARRGAGRRLADRAPAGACGWMPRPKWTPGVARASARERRPALRRRSPGR